MRVSIDMRAKLVRDAGAGRVYGQARFDAVELAAKEQIREAVAEALHEHGIEVDDFYGYRDRAA